MKQISREGSMAAAAHHPSGAKFGGYWKGTDAGPPKPGQGVGGCEEAAEPKAPPPRNFVAKNAKMGGAGQHRDKKREQKYGQQKHKQRELAVDEGLGNKFSAAMGKISRKIQESRLGIDLEDRVLHAIVKSHTHTLAEYSANEVIAAVRESVLLSDTSEVAGLVNETLATLAQGTSSRYAVKENAGLIVEYIKQKRLGTVIVEDAHDEQPLDHEHLDHILAELCSMIAQGKREDPEYYGMVAACVIDPDGNQVAGINYADGTGRRVHAERAAVENYEEQYGSIPPGCVMVTTLSPCSNPMRDRSGDSCTDLMDQLGIDRVYCGYLDPTQDHYGENFTSVETENVGLRGLCCAIADTFLKDKITDDYDPNGVPPGPEFKPTMPAGTVRVDVSDVYDWYKLGQNISNLNRADPKMFGKGPPSTIVSFGSEEEEHKYIDRLQKLGLSTTDIDPLDPNQPKNMPRQKVDPTYNVNEGFDQPYPLKWEKSEYGDYDALARLPDGSPLSIMFNQQEGDEGEKVVQVEFYRNNSQEVTGEGDAQRIFATVLSAIQQYIKEQNPERLTFSASKETDPTIYYEPDEPQPNPESRAKLYDRLVQRYARAWGYRALRADNGNLVIYELTRLKPVKENFADGKHPGRKGLAKRVGVNCKQPVSKLRSIAAHSSGERQRMAHWCANMKSGKKKNNEDQDFFVKELSNDQEVINYVRESLIPEMRAYNVPTTQHTHYTRLSSSIFEGVSKIVDSGKEFLETFKRLDQRRSMKILVGSMVSIINLRMSQDFVELFGFKTPKQITKIYRDPTDNKIIQLEFNNDPEDVWPRKPLASYNGQLILTSALFPNASAVEQALVTLMLAKPDNLNIRSNILETSKKSVSEPTNDLQPGQYYVWRVYFDDGSSTRLKVTNGDFNAKSYYANKGRAVIKVEYNWTIHG